MKWLSPETVPMNGTTVILKTKTGIISGWFCHEKPTTLAGDDGYYDWVCYDDAVNIDGNDSGILGWLPLEEDK